MRSLVAAGIAALAVAPFAPPASAAGTIVLVSGSGSVHPGLGPVPQMQSWTFYAPVTSIGLSGGARAGLCSIRGSGFESVAGGFGSFYGECGEVALDRCTYVRAGSAFDGACANAVTASFTYSYVPASTFTFDGTVHG